ncbi:MAG TPA: hypothetical protein VM364_11250 [Vicinamibacterales bacterium]|nr:hypothetical protein [Vicinamibacterales bacterium]
MRTRVTSLILCLAFVLAATPAAAQYAVRGTSDRATGENYRVEFGGFFWNPDPAIIIRSEALTQARLGTTIDFEEDLGLERTRFGQIKAVLRPGTKHKLRFEYTPIKYEQVGTLRREIVFNGQLYRVAVPVESALRWNAYRFGYEYDIIYRDRGYLGILLEAKYTDVEATLEQRVLGLSEFARARAPIPAIGAVARVYVAPNISITGEVSGFKLPETIDEDYKAHYIDVDVYGTVNLTDHFGAQLGYRSFDVFYLINGDDEGRLKLKGLYFGGVIRF